MDFEKKVSFDVDGKTSLSDSNSADEPCQTCLEIRASPASHLFNYLKDTPENKFIFKKNIL